MATRQDQLHSYQFAVQRVVSALVTREPDPVHAPFRRAAGATLAGVLVAAIGVGAAAAWGALAGGGREGWRRPDAVLVVRETGARYVYREGRLHPVANLASALLLGGGSAPRRVGRAALAGAPRGLPVGIRGAPDAVPARRDLAAGPWSVCSAERAAGPVATLHVGRTPGGGAPLGDGGLLVGAAGAEYLVWHQRRYQLRRPVAVRRALGWSRHPATPVAAALVNSLPPGADLDAAPPPGRGRAVRELPGARVGDVYVVRGQAGAADQYAVAVAGGLAPLSPLEAVLLLAADPRGDGTARPLGVAAFARVPQRPVRTAPAAAPPPTAPPLVAEPGGLCAVVGDDGVAEVRLRVPAGDPAAAVPTGRPAPGGVDLVAVPPGGGALVQATDAGVPVGAVSLVTDVGRRYALGGDEAVRALGYAGVVPRRLPAAVLGLLPAGPGLDPAAAAVHDPAG
ncbi:hypothetical protein GCM10010124_11840 [Pilimelia terevasa]|uniref:Type VII secretion protein EccB n=1 Tax=Pilimelia terevasa TaxID=53372 RepID=A0A8J3FFG2_9ACTN|nr:type VII secretion protein EccB [Pilimelia terevasa]GGK20971.1 hypothetical protein GCM10010124_11840 [Pilimelia terevasa]